MPDDDGAQGPAILQVLPALDGGGVERSALEITTAIRRAGGRALVASAGGRLLPRFEHAGAELFTLDLNSKNPWTIWRNAARLHALITTHAVRLVHARSRAPAWSAWLAARRAGVPFVTTYHGLYREDFPGKHWYNSIMARGARVIANSHFTADHVAQRHGVGPERLRVIPRGVDPVSFDPDAIAPERITRLAAAWRVPDGAPVLLLPARLSPRKGQDVLLRALALMRHDSALAVLVGDAKPADRFGRRLEALASELGIAHRVRFAGHCADMPAAMQIADVVVSAAIEPEAFGRTVIEAQAMRCLVVATDHGGAAETIREGETGWRVPPGDPAALAARLDALLELPPGERLAAGIRARDWVVAHYTVRAMQDATIAVYAELL